MHTGSHEGNKENNSVSKAMLKKLSMMSLELAKEMECERKEKRESINKIIADGRYSVKSKKVAISVWKTLSLSQF